MFLIRHRQHLAFIDVVSTNLLQDLRLNEVSNASLCHAWYRDGSLDCLNHFWV